MEAWAPSFATAIPCAGLGLAVLEVWLGPSRAWGCADRQAGRPRTGRVGTGPDRLWSTVSPGRRRRGHMDGSIVTRLAECAQRCCARVAIVARLTEAVQALERDLCTSRCSVRSRAVKPDQQRHRRAVMLPAESVGDEWSAQMRHLGDQVLAWTGNRMEYLTLTEDELRAAVERREPIVDEWREDCVTNLGLRFDDGAGAPRECRSDAHVRLKKHPCAVPLVPKARVDVVSPRSTWRRRIGHHGGRRGDNVTIGIAVLAGIAAGDDICIRSNGERYSGQRTRQARICWAGWTRSSLPSCATWWTSSQRATTAARYCEPRTELALCAPPDARRCGASEDDLRSGRAECWGGPGAWSAPAYSPVHSRDG